jgi:hypothetical protein
LLVTHLSIHDRSYVKPDGVITGSCIQRRDNGHLKQSGASISSASTTMASSLHR